MAIITSNSQQTTQTITVLTASGDRCPFATVTCNIRPDKSLSFSLDLHDCPGITTDDWNSVPQAVANYLESEFHKATALGIPIMLPG